MRPAAVNPDNRPCRRASRAGITVPGDKSISHRYAMLAALADGVSHHPRLLPGFDCRTTLACLRALGVPHRVGPGLRHDHRPRPDGLVQRRRAARRRKFRHDDAAAVGHPRRPSRFVTTIHRRRSLRPPADAADHRRRSAAMGARDRLGRRPPAADHPRRAGCTASSTQPEVPSAQVKSCVLLAGLVAPRARPPSRNRRRLAIIRSGRLRNVRCSPSRCGTAA